MAGKVVTGLAAVTGLFVGSLTGDMIGALIGGKKAVEGFGLLGAMAGVFAGAAIAANSDAPSGTGVGALPQRAPAPGLGAVPHKCTAKSAAAIAAQIDSSFAYSHSLPPGSQLRCKQTVREYEVVTAMGRKRVPAKFCGGNVMVLECPYTHELFVFQRRAA